MHTIHSWYVVSCSEGAHQLPRAHALLGYIQTSFLSFYHVDACAFNLFATYVPSRFSVSEVLGKN
jgi:hypothetical protein